MTSSEIEIVSDSSKDPKSNTAGGGQIPPEVVILDVFGASAYGDLPKLRKFVEEDGVPLSQLDGNGYYPLQWAALNNFPDVAQYIIEHGGDVHAADNVRQTALHWAAVRGSIAAAEVLLQNGARVEAADVNGYRAVHVAAQYGQTSFLNYIVAKYHADFDVPDNDGRTPLHWSAYKGFADTIRLLLFWDASQGKQDKEGIAVLDATLVVIPIVDYLSDAQNALESSNESSFSAQNVCSYFQSHCHGEYITQVEFLHENGHDTMLMAHTKNGFVANDGCTPLHWAALRGHVEACVVLLHAGTKQELTVKDGAGFTPAQIAADRGHRHVALILSNAHRAHENCWKDKVCIKKAGDIGYAPILFCVIVVSTIIFINSVLFASNLLKVTAVVGLWGWTAVSLSISALLMFIRCSSKDPGYVKMSGGMRNNDDAEGPLLTIDPNDASSWTGNWSQLCPTCKIIRPVRSKHCPACKRCVEQFDHHCPWISNCVGKKNKWDFFVFLCLGTLAAAISGMVAVHRMWTSIPVLQSEESWVHHVVFQHPGAAAFLLVDFFILLAAATLMSIQAYQIGRNLTTNEAANAVRYGYLRGADGRFRNPYNHGWVKNCSDFLIRGYTDDDDDDIAWPPLQQVAR